MSVEEIQEEIDRRRTAQAAAVPGGSVAAAIAAYRNVAPVAGQPMTSAPIPPDPDVLFQQGRDMPPPQLVDPAKAFAQINQPPQLNAAQVEWTRPVAPQPILDDEGNLTGPVIDPRRPGRPPLVDPADPNEYVEITLPGGYRGRVRRDAIQMDAAATPVPRDPSEANYRCMISGTNERSGHPDFYADPRLAAQGVYLQCPHCGAKSVKPLF